jgi:hypothetical protein
MKKMFAPFPKSVLLTATSFTLLSISIFFACQKKEDLQFNSNNLPGSYLKFAGESLTHVNADIRKINSGDGYEKDINILMTAVSTKNMTSILGKLKTQFPLTAKIDNPELLVVYLKNNELTDVTLKNIAGISVWEPIKDKISFHRFFRVTKENRLEEDPKYSVNTGGVLNRDINYLAINHLSNYKSINWVAYRVDKKNLRVSSEGSPKILDFTKAVINNSNVVLTGGALMVCAAANPPCPGAGDGCNPIGECMSWDGAPGGCILNSIEKASNGRLSSNLGLEVARDIRDNFMSKSSVGKKYTESYEKLSQIIINIDTRESNKKLSDYWQMYTDITGIINTIKNGENGEVVVHQDEKTRFLEMIKYYRPISSNKEFQTILNQIEEDLNKLTLKKRTEVLDFIK